MGSCISKCTPKKLSQIEDQEDKVDEVQDKAMVISQIFPLVNQNKVEISPSKTPPPYSSPSSVSSFVTCTASKTSMSTSSSSSLSLSSASSAIARKDNSSFSNNEFSRSCYKESPHVARISSLKKTHNKPQKRVRSNSPITTSASLARQKSFRVDQRPRDYRNSVALKSPSPSRRFGNYQNGEKLVEYQSKRLSSSSSSMGLNYNSASFSRRENFRPSSPSYYANLSRSSLRSAREQRNVHRVGSKIDEIAVAEALARNEIDNLLLVDDIDNPLISLDCFIFI